MTSDCIASWRNKWDPWRNKCEIDSDNLRRHIYIRVTKLLKDVKPAGCETRR